MISPYIPTDKPRLEPSIYEEVLKTYLNKKKYEVCPRRESANFITVCLAIEKTVEPMASGDL